MLTTLLNLELSDVMRELLIARVNLETGAITLFQKADDGETYDLDTFTPGEFADMLAHSAIDSDGRTSINW